MEQKMADREEAMTSRARAARRAPILAALLLVGAASCGADTITFPYPGNGSLSVPAGAQFTIVLQTVGPGEYQSPPAVSSANVQFLDVSQAAVSVPAGPTQQFRFRAVRTGQAVVVFQNSGLSPRLTDTIVVR
jgi:hypothetical protein